MLLSVSKKRSDCYVNHGVNHAYSEEGWKRDVPARVRGFSGSGRSDECSRAQC